MPVVVVPRLNDLLGGYRRTMDQLHGIHLRRRYPLAFALLDSWS
jgi:hypothetical protein